LLTCTESVSVCAHEINEQIQKATKLRIASFVHGADGLGNQNFPPPASKPVDQSAAAFLVEQADLYPGQVTVVALGPLTNLALAVELDPSFAKKIGQIVILGGAYSVNGNVNPAAEANVSYSSYLTVLFDC
jgi:inosine-uridine nucleoside N-ribohydrolase